MAGSAFGLWALLLVLPWQPWRNREVLEPIDGAKAHYGDVTVLIPARDEVGVIAHTLKALAKQAPGIRVVLADDGSTDGTAQVARSVRPLNLTVVAVGPLPLGWSGKLWALEQGLKQVTTDKVLLLDADIQLTPGMLAALLAKLEREKLDLVSIMAYLPTGGVWEKLLLPAFVYFFKLLYPFALANSEVRWIAAAAGGCILTRTDVLKQCGAFLSLKDALIDDCTLAKQVKRRGYRTWIGLSHGVLSQRRYACLGEIWEMVARTAFTQLRYSLLLLGLCTGVMGLMAWAPIGALFSPKFWWLGAAALGMMVLSYSPILSFYRLSPLWGLTLPVIGTLYLLMTWHSALRYLRGERSRWKGRVYVKEKILEGKQTVDPIVGEPPAAAQRTQFDHECQREHSSP
ncbi:MAG: glycosyltransferase [Methylohalobius sp.]|nr:glycosyltransferase [Methylohalobius sp.]